MPQGSGRFIRSRALYRLDHPMPDPTATECIDRASALIRAASAVPGEDEKIRLLEGAEAWLQRAKQLLIAAKAKPGPDAPKR